ncbi:MAG: hypothetical protein KBT10_06935 [Bacteroidales bacterium]|nr:hypothetical protein [Candidatus Sodaliphilus aphodohippi]
MKKFTKLVLAATIMAAAMPSAAQSIIVNNQLKSKASLVCRPNIDMSKYTKRTLAKNLEAYTPISKKVKTKGDDLVTVTFMVNYDKSEMYPSGDLIITSKNYSEDKWMDYDSEINDYKLTCQLPAGTYDFLTPGRFKNNGGILYNVKELVNITNDTTIIFDFAESNIKYAFKTYKPNGEEAKINEYELNEWWEVTDTVTKGNCDYFADDIMIILKGHGVVGLYDCTATFKRVGEYPGETVFINKLSDRYKISSSRVFEDTDGTYIVKYETTDMSETLLANSPEDFVLYEDAFTSIGSDADRLYQGFYTHELVGNVRIGGRLNNELRQISNPITKLYVAPNISNGDDASKFEILVQPVFQDSYFETAHYEITVNDGEGNPVEVKGDVDINRTLTGLPVLLDKNGNAEYVNSGHVGNGNYTFYVPEGGSRDIRMYPGHPQFSFSKDQKVLDYGSSCPINSVMSMNTENVDLPGKYSNLEPCYIGRYGEVVSGCYSVEIKYNDSTICNDCVLMPELLQLFAIQGNPDGVITAHFENTNAVVDGLQGKNTTDVYYDQRNEDWTAPTLQMLQFKDAEGNITDRFDNAEDGILEFAGGDFNYTVDMNEYVSWFNCKEQTVEVSYAPYGGTNWETLEVNEIPDNFFMPGFGYFYRGSLQNIEGEGWFDLKIKLTDLSGNWQEQTISPAFRIGDTQTGIGNVNVGNATEVARYTVDGRAISAPQAGVNIVKMSDGSVKKVWVK